jgi:hypothetical protein
VTGTGTLATLTFVALAPGAGRVTVSDLNVLNTQNQASTPATGSVAINIQ